MVDIKSKFSKIFELKDSLLQVLSAKKKIVIIAGIAVLVLSLGLGGAWFFFFSSPATEEATAESVAVTVETADGTVPAQEEIIFKDIVELEPFERLELKTGSMMKLVNINIALELTDHRYRKQIFSMQERIRKIVIAQVEEAGWLELRNPEGKILLKYSMLKRINAIFPQATVRNIYFTTFIMH